MPVTGAIKFFDRSRCLIADGASATALSGGESINNILSYDRRNYWRSDVGSDAVEEEIEITFSRNSVIDRLLLIDTNLQDISIAFGGVVQDITDINNDPVVLPDMAPPDAPPIYRQNVDTPVIYFEFAPVNLAQITITASKTRIPNEQKYLRQVIAARELGTFEGFPNVGSYDDSHNEIINRASTGVKHITKQIKTLDRFRITFRAHPLENDIALSDRLFDQSDSFTLWPCGGGFGSDHFLFDAKGWQLDDIYNVQTVGRKSHRWYKNFYKSGINSGLRLLEVI